MIAVLLPGFIGVIFIYLGIVTLNGTYKKWYLGPRVFPPQALVYATLPFGIASIGLCIIGLFSSILDPDTTGMLIVLLVGPIFMSGFILALWRPKWIKPYWVWWLEENYSHSINLLISYARQNPEAWQEQVSTQEGLEEWAREIAGEPQPRHRF